MVVLEPGTLVRLSVGALNGTEPLDEEDAPEGAEVGVVAEDDVPKDIVKLPDPPVLDAPEAEAPELLTVTVEDGAPGVLLRLLLVKSSPPDEMVVSTDADSLGEVADVIGDEGAVVEEDGIKPDAPVPLEKAEPPELFVEDSGLGIAPESSVELVETMTEGLSVEDGSKPEAAVELAPAKLVSTIDDEMGVKPDPEVDKKPDKSVLLELPKPNSPPEAASPELKPVAKVFVTTLKLGAEVERTPLEMTPEPPPPEAPPLLPPLMTPPVEMTY